MTDLPHAPVPGTSGSLPTGSPPMRRPLPASSPDFHHFEAPTLDGLACRGTACFAARHANPSRWAAATAQEPRIYCLGQCYEAPAIATPEPTAPHVEVRSREAIVLGRLAAGGARTLDAYRALGGLSALERALTMPPAAVIAELDASGLRGRGGAGFPAARKWQAVLDQPGTAKHIVANADEGDPGAYIDRFLIEGDPFALIEAMAIAGHAAGAAHGWVYLRGEYPHAHRVLGAALDQARTASLLGPSVLGTGFAFDIQIAPGHGSYVCGEETALLNAIEGRRPEVRVRPPYPTERGLYGRPTLVNNVETFASVPWIILNGGPAYAALGIGRSTGTKAVSLNSLFHRPGLYEVEFGTPLRSIVEDCGGGLREGTLAGLWVGGPLAGIVPPDLLDTPLGFDELRAIGCSVGHGGNVAFDTRTSVIDLLREAFEFGAFESCGKCTPCRVGTRHVARLLSGEDLAADADSQWSAIITALEQTSLCGLGTGLADLARSIERYWPEEVERCFARA